MSHAPAAADRRLHPATLVGRTLRAIPETAGGFVAFGAVVARVEVGRLLLIAVVGLAASAVIAFLGWWRFRYGVGEREMVIESGILRRQRRVIPFERVQDIAIEQPLLARLFGTAKVRIETGGSAADEGLLDSVGLDEAHRLRDVVRGRKAGPWGAAPAEATEPVLFAMPLARVLFSGVFNFSLVFIAAMFAAAENAENLGLYDPKALLVPIEARLQHMWMLASLVLLAAVLVLGVVAGVLRTLARDFGFTLSRAPAGFRRRRGLFTLSEAVIPLRRIQLASVESGLVSRALGWHALAFQTLGKDGRGQSAQAAAPLARMEEIAPILAEAAYPDPAEVSDWARSPRRSIVRRAFGPLVWGIAALGVALAWQPEAAAAAAVLLILAIGAPLRWSRHAHSLGGKALFVSGGVLTRRLRVMPYRSAQAIAVYSTPLQRLLRLASVAVDTAGAPQLRSLAVVDLDAADAQALAEKLLAAFKQARKG